MSRPPTTQNADGRKPKKMQIMKNFNDKPPAVYQSLKISETQTEEPNAKTKQNLLALSMQDPLQNQWQANGSRLFSQNAGSSRNQDRPVTQGTVVSPY